MGTNDQAPMITLSTIIDDPERNPEVIDDGRRVNNPFTEPCTGPEVFLAHLFCQTPPKAADPEQLVGDGDCVAARVHSPFTEQLLRAARRTSANVEAVETSNKWKPLKRPQRLKESQAEVIDVDRACRYGVARVRATIEASVESVMEAIRTANQSATGSCTTLLERIPCQEAEICLLRVEMELPGKDRDFVICQSIMSRGEGSYEVVRMSLPENVACEWSPPSSRHVRGCLKMHSMLVSPVDGEPEQCHVRWISCVDLKEVLPSLAELTARQGTHTIIALQQAVIRSRGARFATGVNAAQNLEKTNQVLNRAGTAAAAPPA